MSSIADSVKARLKNQAQATGRPFQELLQLYALERFLRRVAVSPHVESLVLKGAMMLRAWQAPVSRSTRDIDFLGRLPNDRMAVQRVIEELCVIDPEPDGLVFDIGTIRSENITDDAEYVGVRVKLTARLDRTRVPIQLDIGFGDAVTPEPEKADYPTLLDMPAPHVYMYRRETSVAEKAQVIADRGVFNSRLKDYYDLWLLAGTFDFEGSTLLAALRATFSKRATPVPREPAGLTPEFFDAVDKKQQWAAFLRRHAIDHAPASLAEVTNQIRGFLLPTLAAAIDDDGFAVTWSAQDQEWR